MLKRVKLSGFMSIREMDLELGPLNVLIGANGSGKSNLLAFFRLLQALVADELQLHVARGGGARAFLHYGPQQTPSMGAFLEWSVGPDAYTYEMELSHASPDVLVFTHERATAMSAGSGETYTCNPGAGDMESRVAVSSVGHGITDAALPFIRDWSHYHVHDTSPASRLRGSGYLHENHHLRGDAANLAAYLYMLRETRREYYERIVATIRLAAPFFGDFVLAPMELNPNNILLEWRERESDYLFGPHQLSDGLLRLMALVTLLRQPEDRLPSLIIIDEPELGLHPYALEIVVSLLESVSTHAQVIVATQSAPLVDMCDPDTIVVVDRIEGRSEFRRLRPADLAEWLAEYSLGELWEKNVLGGRPAR